MSDAKRAAPSVSPSTSGVSRRAATTRSGSSAETTAIENEPATTKSAARTASARPTPVDMLSSMRWARTSVSVADVIVCPEASSRAPISVWFSMIPLCTTATRPVQS